MPPEADLIMRISVVLDKRSIRVNKRLKNVEPSFEHVIMVKPAEFYTAD